MFPKPGKNKRDHRNYRPISLLPTMGKLFEKLIHSRLKYETDEKNIIPNIQFGFRNGLSTNHQLARVAQIIEMGFENKKYTTSVFLDVAKAFDTVWIEGLKYKLNRLGLPYYLLRILLSFLNNRTFCTRVNGTTSTTRNIKAGVPQGSVLSPILFNIYMHDIPISTMHEKAMFADDLMILTQNENLEDAIEQLQRSTDTLCKWLEKWCIRLNESKCEAKIFTLKRYRHPPEICINEVNITWNPSDKAVKYLGVYLDQRLTWSYHINYRLNLGYTRLRQLYPLINRNSTMKVQCSLLLYKSLIRPLIMYACQVWFNTTATNFKKLQTLQNKILRIITNAPWFVRNRQIHNELKMETIKMYAKRLTKKFYTSISNCDNIKVFDIGKKEIHTRLKRRLPQDLIQEF